MHLMLHVISDGAFLAERVSMWMHLPIMHDALPLLMAMEMVTSVMYVITLPLCPVHMQKC